MTREHVEAERLRIQDQEARDEATRAPQGPADGAVRLIGRTKEIDTYPATAGVFFAMETVSIFGAEIEGGSGTKTALGDTFFALNLGSAVPPEGSDHEVTRVQHRYVFRYDG